MYTSTLPASRPSMKEVLKILIGCRDLQANAEKIVGIYDDAPLLKNSKWEKQFCCLMLALAWTRFVSMARNTYGWTKFQWLRFTYLVGPLQITHTWKELAWRLSLATAGELNNCF
ncbi:hypothetical protein KIW84_061442 [Lathyrus oleraceus]|uniref:Uncharacterized protein n=1 Tax=Pisum sativum TaxID=3888 RepID=A0A9D4W5N8_PEA|nr:hypothetical protein KIW84_061442 [Pisum sativum]